MGQDPEPSAGGTAGGSSGGDGGSPQGGSGGTSTGGSGGSVGGSAGDSGGTAGSPGGSAGSSSGGNGGESAQAGAGGDGGAVQTTENDCLDGVDNDGDQKIDCADADCSGFRCIPKPPPGWDGPVMLVVGDGDTSPPDCDEMFEEFPFEAFAGGLADYPEAQCSCTCSATCQPPWRFNVFSCANPYLWLEQANDGECVATPTEERFGGAQVDEVLARAAKCEAQGSQYLPPEQWTARVRACSAHPFLSGGCGFGSACVPVRGVSFFSEAACVSKNGDQVCPADFPEKHIFHESYADYRGCVCECSAGGCERALTAFSDAICTTGTEVAWEECTVDGPRSVQADTGPATCDTIEGAAPAQPTGTKTFCCVAP